jgi:hypothetical protein
MAFLAKRVVLAPVVDSLVTVPYVLTVLDLTVFLYLNDLVILMTPSAVAV